MSDTTTSPAEPIYTETDGPGQLPEGPLPEGFIALVLEIENTYEDGDEITTWYTVVIPAPPVPLTQPDAREHEDYDGDDGWEYVHIYGRTGTGRSKGDAWYDVTVLASSDPVQVPAGETFEFGY